MIQAMQTMRTEHWFSASPAGLVGTGPVPEPSRWLVPVPERHIALDYQGATLTRHHRREWSGVSALLTDGRSQDGFQVELKSEHVLLSAVLEQVGGRVTIEASGGRAGADLRRSPNPISVIPAGTNARATAGPVQHFSHLVLQLDLQALAGMFDEPLDLDAALRARPAFADDAVLALCRLLASECAKRGSNARLFGESLLVSLLIRLARMDGPQTRGGLGGLAPWQLRRVLDYFETHFAEDVSLTMVSVLVGLSPSHFSRAFKQSTACSPQRWLTELRCSKAKQMLLENHLGLAEIALATGFCDQSHFTRTFSQTEGTPPAAWRRARIMSAPPRGDLSKRSRRQRGQAVQLPSVLPLGRASIRSREVSHTRY